MTPVYLVRVDADGQGHRFVEFTDAPPEAPRAFSIGIQQDWTDDETARELRTELRKKLHVCPLTEPAFPSVFHEVAASLVTRYDYGTLFKPLRVSEDTVDGLTLVAADVGIADYLGRRHANVFVEAESRLGKPIVIFAAPERAASDAA